MTLEYPTSDMALGQKVKGEARSQGHKVKNVLKAVEWSA